MRRYLSGIERNLSLCITILLTWSKSGKCGFSRSMWIISSICERLAVVESCEYDWIKTRDFLRDSFNDDSWYVSASIFWLDDITEEAVTMKRHSNSPSIFVCFFKITELMEKVSFEFYLLRFLHAQCFEQIST